MDAERDNGGDSERDRLNEISGKVIQYAIDVHKELGPGMLEKAYEMCLAFELAEHGFGVKTQLLLPIHYKGLHLDAGYRIDMLVEDSVIVELKAIDRLLPVNEAQLLSYLRMSDLRLGLLINFNGPPHRWRATSGQPFLNLCVLGALCV